jgi:LysR family transcriptional regulator for metE and metH
MNHPRVLETRDLELVTTIVECGGLARAAQRLHCTPSALSHRLADLERRLRIPLFTRSARRLLPTPAAEALRAGAEEVLARLAELESAAFQAQRGRLAVLRVATSCFTCYHWLPALLASFEAMEPQVEVRIVPGATRHAVRSLLEGQLDLALTDTPPRDVRLVAHPLFESRMVAIVSPAHAWAKRRQVAAADFEGVHLLRYDVPRQDSTLVAEILDPAGVRVGRDETLPLTEAIVELVRVGRGVAVLPSWVVAPWVARGEIAAVPLSEAASRRRWCAVVRRQSRPDPHLTALVTALRELELPGARRLARPPRRDVVRAS